MNYTNIQKAAGIFMVTVGLITAGTTWGAEFWLRAGTTTNTMPDGRQVVMWGFARDSADGAGDGLITVPGPQLNVISNDGLVIHLQNTLPEPVSVVIPGQYNAQSFDPVFHSGGAYDGRVRSLTHEAAASGGKATYTWTSVQPGTFLYHSGSHPSVEVQMGLYGALAVVAPGPAVYPGVPFNSSVSLLFSEIDPDVHDAVSGATFGPGPSFHAEDFTNAAAFYAQITGSADPVAAMIASHLSSDPSNLVNDLNTLVGGSSLYDPLLFPDTILTEDTVDALFSWPEVNQPLTGIPYNGFMVRLNRLLLQDGLASSGIVIPPVKTMTSTIRSYAQYFLINGQAYTNGQAPIYVGAAGSTNLLRLLNAGMDAHVPTLNNAGDLRLVGEDGQQAPYVRNSSVIFLPALKTVDALWTPTVPGTNAIYDRRLGLVNASQSPGGMLAYLAVSAPNVVAVAPAILVQPANHIAFIGQSATFSVIATHVRTLTYQWRLNGVPIGGAIGASYTIPAVSAASLGNYTVVVTDGALSTTSAAATLTVVTQPAPVTVIEGGSATFTVTNRGPAAITYQWQNNGVPITGATNSSYTLVVNYATNNGNLFSVVVNGLGGPATSGTALLTVTPIAPVITTQPASTNVPDFTPATFSVVATGSALTYQWQRSPTLSGNNFTDITGATGSSYTFIVNRANDNNTRYRVTVSRSSVSPVTSTAATLTVTAVGVQILTQPANTLANYGQPTNLSVVARASGALSYVWQKSNTVTHVWNPVTAAGGISGVTSATLAFNGTATANLANNGAYRVIVNAAAVAGVGGIGPTSATSATAQFTIVIVGPRITLQPVNVITNDTARQVVFTVDAIGFPTPTYQWQRMNNSASWVNLTNGGGSGISGATTPTLTIAGKPQITVGNAGSYRVVLNNLGGSASATGTLTVIQTFAGQAVTTIPISGGSANPYPAFTPSGSATVPAFLGASVKHVTVNITLTHPEPYDVNALISTPNNSRKVEFMAGLGPYQAPFETPAPGGVYTYPVTNMSLTFDDAALTPVPSIFPITTGTFKPTVALPVAAFLPPAPGLPYSTNFDGFTDFVQTTAGDWRLYVNDVLQDIPPDAALPNGRIPDWSLTLTVGP